MQFGFLGINYKKAQLDIRDKTSFTDNKKIEFLQQAENIGIEQCMVLSTCNRSEIYYFYEKETERAAVKELYQQMFPDIDLKDYLTEFYGVEAISYLYRIAAGLESLVLGEDQILGQVKEALDFSRTVGYSKKELNKVVRDAVTCAKKIKTELKVSEKPLSVSYIGIQKLNELCGIAGKTILVIGSGKTAVLALKYIYEYGAGCVLLCSRTLAHAKELREQFPDIGVIEYEMRYQAMEQCDIVISATSSPHRVVKKGRFEVRRPMAFLDLATPRDVDTALLTEEDVQLLNLDTLQQIAAENQKERERLVEESRSMIEDAIKETLEWLKTSRMDATIESLQERCDEIVEDSFAYLNRKIEFGVREQKILRKVLNASLHRLLKEPIQELKQLETKEEQEAYKELVHRLFQIQEKG